MCYVPKQKADIVYIAECEVCGNFHLYQDGECEKDSDCEQIATFKDTEELIAKFGQSWQLECFAELVWIDEKEEEPRKVA